MRRRLVCLLFGHRPANWWIADGGEDVLGWPTGHAETWCQRCRQQLATGGGALRVKWPGQLDWRP